MEEKERKKYGVLIKDTIIFALGSLGSKFMLFILVPLYTNCLSPEEYGTADLIFTISQLVIPVLTLTIYDAVLRFGLSKDEHPSNVLLCALAVWFVGSLVSLVLTPLFGLYQSIAKWKWFLSLYMVVQMLFYIQQSYLKTVNKNKLYAIVSILHALFLALFNVVLLVFVKLKIEGYLLANIFASLSMSVFMFFFGKMWTAIKQAKFDKLLLKRMIVYSSPLILNNISWWGIQSANKIIVELALDATALGLFTVATKIPALINVIITIFSQAWGISSIREVETTSNTSFYSSVFKIYTFLAFGACVAILTVIKPFMGIYVGAEFSSAWKFVPLLLVGSVFSAISSYCGSLYGALKKSVNNMISTFVAAVAGIVFALIFIRIIDLWAAILGTLLSYLIVATIRIFDVRRFIKFKINWFVFLSNVVLITVQSTLVTLEWYAYIVSAITVALFICINAKSILEILRKKGEQNEKS